MSSIERAMPTVTNVKIMGEPDVDGTVSGSYLYQNAEENLEGHSIFCWYNTTANNEIVAETVDLTLLPEHAGIALKFSVIPVSSTGERGVETFSDIKTVGSGGYQNITTEESENSYLKQQGRYAYYANGASDRMLTATAGAFALKNRVTQNVSVRGATNFGGVVPPELAGYLNNNPAITMFSTLNSFAAMVPVGGGNQLLVWGPGIPVALPDLQDIKAVYSNSSSLAFIYSNPKPGANTIGAVGTQATGGVVPIEIQNKLFFDQPKAIYATTDAFAVLTLGGKVYTWGSTVNGGVVPAAILPQLNAMTVQRIVASRTAFCAIDGDGYVIAWGANGVISAATLEKIYDDGGAQTVVANDSAFCVITRGRSKAVTWGLAAHGGVMTEPAASLAARGNIVLCSAAAQAMCFINKDGQAAAWGAAAYGGGAIPASSSLAAETESSMSAQELLEEDTRTEIEKLFQSAPVVSPRSMSERVSSRVKTDDGGEVQLVRNDSSFVLVSKQSDGRIKAVISWGLAAAGGTIPAAVKQTLLASNIRKIYCSNGAYAALVDQGAVTGAVVTWGKGTFDGGVVPAALQSALTRGVVEIYTIQGPPSPAGNVTAAFAARKENNSFVTWGGHIKNEEFTPDKNIVMGVNQRAIPIASGVLIMGEVVIGSVVRGSYRYENTDENPEAASRYQWYLNDTPIPAPEGVAIDLRVKLEYAGKRLKFSVIPVAASGETGVETFSSEKLVESGFQGISLEENENSYLKQYGNFSFHVPEPSGRIFVSTGGAFGLIDPETQSLYFQGQAGWGLPVPASIINFLQNNPAAKLFSTERDFAALVNVQGGNQLLVWGANIPANISVKLTDIKSVYSNRECFAFIYKNVTGNADRIGAIGRQGSGNVIAPEIQSKLWFDEPVAIYATQNAFAVRTTGGKVYAWGNQANGGLINPTVRALLDGVFVERIIAAANAFCAIGTHGEIVTWGVADSGGAIPSAQLDSIFSDGGVASVTASTTAFCAITRSRRKAVSWGRVAEGGLMSASASLLALQGDVIVCKANRWSFCIINSRGQAEAWGAPRYGGASLTQTVKRNIKRAVKQAGALHYVSDARLGSRIITVDGILSLYSNDVAFFLLSQHENGRTNEVVVWGMNTHGGAMSSATRQALLASLVTGVYSTNGAFGVVATQGGVYGAVIVWGATLAMEDAGEIPPVPPDLAGYLSRDVVELYSIKRFPYVEYPPPPPPIPPHTDPSFAARRRDGSYVLWGGNVVNQYYKPDPLQLSSLKLKPRRPKDRTRN